MRRAASAEKTTRGFWFLWIVRNRQTLMSSKKKSSPLFEVPAEIGSGRESGWVYRSGTPEKEAPQTEAPEKERPRKERPAPRESSGADLGAESAQTLAMAFATLAR